MPTLKIDDWHDNILNQSFRKNINTTVFISTNKFNNVRLFPFYMCLKFSVSFQSERWYFKGEQNVQNFKKSESEFTPRHGIDVGLRNQKNKYLESTRFCLPPKASIYKVLKYGNIVTLGLSVTAITTFSIYLL